MTAPDRIAPVTVLLAALACCAASVGAADPADPATRPADANVLLADDFEDGIAKGWLAASKGLKTVLEDPDDPNGNHVLRMTEYRQRLISPPAADADAAKQRETAYEVWDDYEFSFRVRVHPTKTNPRAAGRVCTFLLFAWRVHPHEDNPSERQLVFVQAWRHRSRWRLSGPKVSWYRAHRGYETKNIRALHENVLGKLDSDWHRVLVRCRADRVQLYWDGKLYFDGADDRVLSGGVSISYWWTPGPMTPAPIDIDDVLVRRIPANAGEPNEPNQEAPE